MQMRMAEISYHFALHVDPAYSLKLNIFFFASLWLYKFDMTLKLLFQVIHYSMPNSLEELVQVIIFSLFTEVSI